MTTSPKPMPVLLRRSDITAELGIPTSTLYQMMANGRFPKPIKIGAKTVAWLRSDVSLWLQSQIEVRG